MLQMNKIAGLINVDARDLYNVFLKIEKKNKTIIYISTGSYRLTFSERIKNKLHI